MTAIHFTPSLHDGQTLEDLFTGRERELNDTVGRIGRAVAKGQLSHTLFVGPRGAGKTHLIALVHHRAQALDGHGQAFRLAWVDEDAWMTVTSFADLMSRIEASVTPIEGLDASAGRGLTVVLVENFDYLLDQLGEDGQRQLRAHIERHGDLLLVASTTTLTAHLMSQAEPFYGFFAQVRLAGFTTDQAVAMLQALARHRGDRALAARLDEPGARARLAAVGQLTGGQPRVWSLLADGLDPAHLDELAGTVVSRFDDLTPVYQGEFARLSAQERQAVMALVEADHPMTVKALAATTGIDRAGAGAVAKSLRAKHWIQARSGLLSAHLDKRNTYYELAEPLARVYFQIKASRGEPVKLIVEFLAAWYGSTGLGAIRPIGASASYVAGASSLAGKADYRLRDHLAEGLTVAYARAHPAKRQPDLVEACRMIDDALSALQHAGSAVTVMGLPSATVDLLEDQLASRSPSALRLRVAYIALEAGGEREWVGRALDALPDVRPDEDRGARVTVACLRLLSGDFAAGLESLDAALKDNTQPWTLEQIQILGSVFENSLSPLPPAVAQAFVDRMSAATPAVPRDDGTLLVLRSQVARLVGEVGRVDEAISLLRDVLADRERVLGPDHPDTLTTRHHIAYWTGQAGRVDEAISLLRDVLADLQRVLGPDHPDTLTTCHHIAYWTGDAGRVDEAINLSRDVLADLQRVLGPVHPDTLTTRHNIAYWTGEAGRVDEAIGLLRDVLADCERVLGRDHPHTLTTRHHIAYWTGEAGRVDEAIGLLRDVLADRERVLGPDHPHTLTTRRFLDRFTTNRRRQEL
ncbi:MAG: tetratricopeptide repeat protein [Bifidobacteriaceae bacterium]|jgi:hypothetical protein|nr:tetratricopeptide repeat protein [Bifidobacteriaceae bacterium]